MNKRFLSVIMIITIMTSYLQATTLAASGKAYVFYYNSPSGALGPGTTQAIKSYLQSCGYTSYRYGNSGKTTVLTYMGTGKVFHILTHGASSFFCVGENDTISISTIKNFHGNSSSALSNLRFAFFEACYLGSGSFQTSLSNLGVSSSLAFMSTISASTSSNGIHCYADRFYIYATDGYTVYQSHIIAKNHVYGLCGSYHGSESARIYGGSSTIN